MKVLLVNGSPHKDGNTYIALKEMAEQLKVQEIESEILWIGNQPARGCIDCCVCRKKNLGRCVFEGDMYNKPIVTSQYWNILFGCGEGETAFDVEGLQTMRTLANNMAWLLKKLHNEPTTSIPEREEYTAMNFIRR
jgi:hypothetical protein